MPEDLASDASGAAARGARVRGRTRRKILDATEQLMTRTPLDDLRLEQVAAEAGVSPATLYVHFGTRDALVAAAVNRLLRVVLSTFADAVAVAPTPAEKIRAIGLTASRLISIHPAIATYVAHVGTNAPQTDAERETTAEIVELLGAFDEIIAAAIGESAIAEIAPRALSRFMFGAWIGVAGLAVRRDGLAVDPQELERILNQCWAAMFDGLERGTPATP